MIYRRYITYFGMLFSLLTISEISESQEKEIDTIAIFNLEAKGVSNLEVEILSEKFRYYFSSIVNSNEYVNSEYNQYDVVERAEIDKILDEHEFQMSGCVSDSCALEFGKMLQADTIIVGLIGLIGETYSATVRMIDVETTKTLGTASSDYKGPVDELLTTVIKDIASELIYGLTQEISTKIVERFNDNYFVTKKVKDPIKAFLFSLIPPFGWGHFYNGQIKKGVLVSCTELIGVYLISYGTRPHYTTKTYLNTGIVLAGGALIYSIFDSPFSAMKINDSYLKSTYYNSKRFNISLGINNTNLDNDFHTINLTYRF